MPATTRDLRTTHVASNHGWWQHSWVTIVITSDGSKNTRCQRPHAIPVTTLGVDCIMMIYQARILSSFDTQWEYDVSSRCDVSSKCSLPTGTCFSTGNSLVYIHIGMYKNFNRNRHIRLSDWLSSILQSDWSPSTHRKIQSSITSATPSHSTINIHCHAISDSYSCLSYDIGENIYSLILNINSEYIEIIYKYHTWISMKKYFSHDYYWKSFNRL